MKTIGTMEVSQGEKKTGYLQVASDTDGSPIQLPLLVANGRESGPTVWVIGCVHGDEYGGAASIIDFFQEIDVEELAGTFVGLPVANPPSFKAWSRISPMDGVNLNRIFPGNPKGTYSQRLAHVLLETITETADYVIDLHSGGIALHVPFFMICKDGHTEAAKKSLWLAERMGADIIWIASDDGAASGTGTDHYMKHGIPSVTVEVGGGTVTPKHVRLFKESIVNSLKALKMISGDAPIQESYKVYKKAEFIFAGEGGLFVPACKVGSILKKGDRIGTIINLHGEVTEEIVSPFDHAFLAATGNLYWPTEPGRLIAETYTI